MATIKITTFDTEVLAQRLGLNARLRLRYGGSFVIDFPLTENQYLDLEGGDSPQDRRVMHETFVAMKFGKLFEMLAEWEAGADARSLIERGV